MTNRKHELLSAEETADILGIQLKRLYNVCNAFDARSDDQWDLIEGEHFEWLSKSKRTRRFHEEGAMAIARFLQETDTAGAFAGFIDTVIEKFTNRRKRTRQLLVRRRVILEVQSLDGVGVRGDLVFIERSKVIRILATNGKGLNAAASREQKNSSLSGREPMESGVHFDTIEDTQHWSQRGIVRIAQNMSEKLAQKSRRAWTEAVAEVYEDAIEQQKKYLDSFDAKVRKAKDEVKKLASYRCQVTSKKSEPHTPFDLHAHHLFDQSTRPDLATLHENLLVLHPEVHDGFHSWNGSGSCEPKGFIEYLTIVESWRFKTARDETRLHQLINRLERLQQTFESHYEVRKQFK